MVIRRVVTGHREGRARVISDGMPPTEHRYEAIPGMMTSILWAASTAAPAEVVEGAPVGTSNYPAPGEMRVVLIELPPDAVWIDPAFDPAAAFAEQDRVMPGFVQYFEPDNPGMHRTPTVDVGFVLDGEVWLELDDGEETHLAAGAVVVQQGTRHAWRNRTERPVRLAFAMYGATAGNRV